MSKELHNARFFTNRKCKVWLCADLVWSQSQVRPGWSLILNVTGSVRHYRHSDREASQISIELNLIQVY